MRNPEDIILVFDYDGVICAVNDGSYHDAPPYPHAIEHINKAYDMGYQIHINTARYGNRYPGQQYQVGYEEALEWLHNNNVKFHQLIMEKPAGDLYVDDKGCRVESKKGNEDWLLNFWPAVEELAYKNSYGRDVREQN